MPYISKAERENLAAQSLSEAEHVTLTPGQFNYIITQCCVGHLKDRGLSYTALNEIVGALECAKLELYRRVAAPYEDKKCAENGDVYP